jgi:hypothetical protein
VYNKTLTGSVQDLIIFSFQSRIPAQYQEINASMNANFSSSTKGVNQYISNVSHYIKNINPAKLALINSNFLLTKMRDMVK